MLGNGGKEFQCPPTPPYILNTFLVVADMYKIHMVVITDRWLNLEANSI